MIILKRSVIITSYKGGPELEGKGAASADPREQASALEHLPDSVVLFDSNQRVAYLNLRAKEMLASSSAEMIGRERREVFERLAARTTDRDATFLQLERALAGGDEIVLDLDPYRVVSARFFALAARVGDPPGVGMLLRDVTRERTADAMKAQLLSTVSHELRTPLASIKGFATTLLRQDVKWDETTQRDFLRIIEEESDRLTEIIDNLLDMSQMEAGTLRIAKEPTQLRTLIREVVDAMRMRTEAHWFVMDLPVELPRINGDPRRIRQVLRNLLENAVKYSKGGQVTVACEVESAQVVVNVSDQGEGIPAEHLERIFERFFQVDGKSTRRVGGAGLGLSISRGIIQAHGGKMWAENLTGGGSVFRFTLPIAPSE